MDEPPTPEQILDLKVCDPAMGSGAFLVESGRQLGEALIEAWSTHGGRPEMPADEDEVVFARRLVAQRCLYGVDRNPVAVDLAKVSLWLLTLARDHALTFVDHALRHGDSLVGLTRTQIESFHWGTSSPGFEAVHVRERLDRVAELRHRIRHADDAVPDWELRDLWNRALHEVENVRLYGDLVVAAFFKGDKPKEREKLRNTYAQLVLSGDMRSGHGVVEQMRRGIHLFEPFHWEIEYPEVFDRPNPGFDGFVGNPPFVTGTDISSYLGTTYRAWLTRAFPDFRNRANLCVVFLLRAASMVRREGALGFVLTNTASEGDSRVAGLLALIESGEWTIVSASTNIQWPGTASLHVHHVHMWRGSPLMRALLNGHQVDRISSNLTATADAPEHSQPVALAANADLSFTGERPYGNGGFDLSRAEAEQMRALLVREGLTGAVRYIRPYLSGEDLNGRDGAASRCVIDFTGLTLEEARATGPLFDRVEEVVRPFRQQMKEQRAREQWWLFQRSRPGLRASVKTLPRVLVAAGVSKHLSFTFIGDQPVFHNNLCIFAIPDLSGFCLLQSRVFETWARRFSSTLDTRLKLSTRDAFETYPFPEDWVTCPALDSAGDDYYAYRAELVRQRGGLTAVYNCFHDPDEPNAEIGRLRELHAAMDRAVLDAYGWSDIATDCEFLLDFEIAEEEWGRKKKPYRYRWSDDVRDEVLARLLELNARRAAEEARLGSGKSKNLGRKTAAERSLF